MTRYIWRVAVLAAFLIGGMARAQETWVQIEARPSLAEAEERARAYASVFANVAGFRLASGWYGIALGPYAPEAAQAQLELLRNERMIPADSYIAEGKLGRRFWPVGAEAAGTSEVAGAGVPPETAALPEVTVAEPPVLDETPGEARISESLLDTEDRQDLQRAMQFFGVYPGKIDGSFGQGTRAAMAVWQDQNSQDATGILTTLQRQALITAWRTEREALGLIRVAEAESGIEIDLPLGLVEFDRYQPPFVRYKPKDASGFEVLLISRQGDSKTLVALYDRLQALEIMPMAGERGMGRSSFTINGANASIGSYAQAELSGGQVKGFVLVWPLADTGRAVRVLEVMKATFLSQGDAALDENLGEPSQTAPADLVAGLEVRRPALSRSGVFIDAAGSVLTTTEVLDQCGRITLDSLHAADLAFRDDRLGIAVLKPQTALAPRAVAELQTGLPRADADVALAGYSYEDRIGAPVVSFGSFAEGKGLKGEDYLTRLDITTLPGDAGGAVLDASGAMIGMLLPQKAEDGRKLPDGVGFALNSGAVATALAANGVLVQPSTRSGSLASEDLAELARSMTVLVSCWK